MLPSASMSLPTADDDANDIVDALAAAVCRSPAKKSLASTADGFRDIDVSNTGDRKAWRRPLAPAYFGRESGREKRASGRMYEKTVAGRNMCTSECPGTWKKEHDRIHC